MPPPSSRERLEHMLKAATDAVEMSRDSSRQGLETDRKLTYALIHCITVIGEVARHVDNADRNALADLP